MRARRVWWLIALGVVLLMAMALPAVGARNVGTEETFEIYADQAAAVTAGFEFGSPWNLVTEALFWAEPRPGPILPFDGSQKQAVYLGYISPNTGLGSYDGIPAGDPTFKTDVQSLSGKCDFVTVKWDQVREVEYYLKGGYDKTWVEMQFYAAGVPSGAPVTIWAKDCKDPSAKVWQTISGPVPATLTQAVPVGADAVQLLFNFDAVDSYHNNYFGWLIDDVQITCSEQIPTLSWKDNTPTNLPQGEEGRKYGVDHPNNGGGTYYDLNQWVNGPTDDRRFVLAELCDDPDCVCGCTPLVISDDPRDPHPNPLPERVTLSEDGHLVGMVEPGKAGTYKFRVMVQVGQDPDRDYSCICREFTVAIHPPTGAAGSIFEDFDPTPPAWTQCWTPPPANVNLWHFTQSPSFQCLDLTDFENVLYFGQDDKCNYDTGKRVKGCECSTDLATPDLQGYNILLGFKSYRDVEFYTPKAFDETWVEVSVDGGTTWTKVWYKSSMDACVKAWTWEQVDTGVAVTNHQAVMVRFCFDSIDGYGNNYLGWLVDEVLLQFVESTLHITTQCPLPEGWVGEPYSVELTYTGGAANLSANWRVENGPDGLVTFEDTVTHKWYLKGTPRDPAGTYHVKLILDVNGTTISTICDLVINPKRCYFFEDFEEDPVWSFTGLWGRRDKAEIPFPPAPVDVEAIAIGAGNHVAYYGNAGNALNPLTYLTGDRTLGELSLMANPLGIDVTGRSCVTVSFNSFRKVESNLKGGYDKTKVQIRWDNDPTWHVVWYKDSANKSDTAWQLETANKGNAFPVPQGATRMWIRFAFDSIDRYYNNYFGWMIDNIKVCFAATCVPIDPNIEPKGVLPDRASAAEISVMNMPNPVTDVHTTTFTVRGLGVEAIKIQIFDLNETLVFEQEIAGNELVWHTENTYGENLANGVYFYRAFALIGGEWLQTKFEKLVILR